MYVPTEIDPTHSRVLDARVRVASMDVHANMVLRPRATDKMRRQTCSSVLNLPEAPSSPNARPPSARNTWLLERQHACAPVSVRNNACNHQQRLLSGPCIKQSLPNNLGDDRGLSAPCHLGQIGNGKSNLSNGLDNIKRVLVEVAGWVAILLEVHTDGGACDAGAG